MIHGPSADPGETEFFHDNTHRAFLAGPAKAEKGALAYLREQGMFETQLEVKCSKVSARNFYLDEP